MAVGGGGSNRSSARSLDVVEGAVRIEREAQLKHGDALDAKAGVMLGFAGALAALAPTGVHVLVDAGRIAAVGGALMALWAFWPRGYGTTDLRLLRDRYLAAEPAFSRLHLTDTQIAVVERVAVTLDDKAGRVRSSMVLLASAATLVTAGLLVE